MTSHPWHEAANDPVLSTTRAAKLAGMEPHHLSAYVSPSHGSGWKDCFPRLGEARMPNGRQLNRWSYLDVVVIAVLRELIVAGVAGPWRVTLAEQIRENIGAPTVTATIADGITIEVEPDWSLLGLDIPKPGDEAVVA